MPTSIKLGHIWGIPIGLHFSWFLIFGLVTWSLAWGYFPAEYPMLSPTMYWFLGALTSLLFFGSVLLHELGHTRIALRNQIPVRGITLFLFGGVAQIAREPQTPGAEFRIAIAGPAVSFVLAGVFGGLWFLDQHIPYFAAPSEWLARINLGLAVFNLIPGFPLDGGRVLRALVWRMTGNLHRSTQVAAFTGQLAAFGFMMWGVLIILEGNFFNGLWIMLIGWFLQNAAAASYAQSNMQQSLRDVTVAQVMTRGCPKVASATPLAQLVEQQILTGAQRTFLVADNGRVQGLLTSRDIATVPQAAWQGTRTEQVMVPSERLARVQPSTELFEALQTMNEANVAQVPVMEGDNIVGMLSREQALHYVRIHAELGM